MIRSTVLASLVPLVIKIIFAPSRPFDAACGVAQDRLRVKPTAEFSREEREGPRRREGEERFQLSLE